MKIAGFEAIKKSGDNVTNLTLLIYNHRWASHVKKSDFKKTSLDDNKPHIHHRTECRRQLQAGIEGASSQSVVYTGSEGSSWCHSLIFLQPGSKTRSRFVFALTSSSPTMVRLAWIIYNQSTTIKHSHHNQVILIEDKQSFTSKPIKFPIFMLCILTLESSNIKNQMSAG